MIDQSGMGACSFFPSPYEEVGLPFDATVG